MDDQCNALCRDLSHLNNWFTELESKEMEPSADNAYLKQLYEQSLLSRQNLNGDGQLTEVNQTWLDILCYSREEVIGKKFSDFLHPSSRDHFKDLFPRFKANQEIPSIEFEMLRKDGSSLLVQFDGKINKDPTGRFQSLDCVFKDITERKWKETYRRMGREVLRILTDSGDLSNSLQKVISVLKTRTGFDAVGLRLQDGDDFPYFAQKGFSEDFLSKENSLRAPIEEGKPCQNSDGGIKLECTCGLVISGKIDPASPFFTLGGSFWINNSFSLGDMPSLEDSRVQPRNQCIHHNYASIALVPIRSQERIVGLIQFNDARKQCFTRDSIEVLEEIAFQIGSALMRMGAEEALHQTEERYRTLFNSLLEGFCIVEMIFDSDNRPMDYRFLEVNPAFEEQTGFKNVRGRLMRDLVPDLEPHWFELLGNIAVSGEPARFVNEAKALNHWYDIYAYRFGKPEDRQVAVVFNNITGHKLAEMKLKAINDELEQMVDQRTLKLQETQKQYLHAEKLSAIGKLSASIAHEFNNPLQGIMSILKGLKKRAILEDEDKELLDAAIGEGDRLKNLIHSLQEFNRPSSGKPVLMDVHECIDSILLLNKSDLKDKRISVVLHYAKQLPEILAVPDQIQQVMLNLLANAADACQQLGGEITISTWRAGDNIAVAIKDTGIGMKSETLERIFQPFYSTKSEVKGIGLGLSVSYGIIKHHKGEIRVESQPGKGTTFIILLPVKGDAGVAIQAIDHQENEVATNGVPLPTTVPVSPEYSPTNTPCEN